MFFVALLLPLWGLLILLILHFQIFFKADNSIEIGVERLKLESELYKSVTIDNKKTAATTVPIEEALVINSAKERRSIIMDVLNDNPKEYIQFLQKAGNNEDTEVVHYAVTAMVEISKENDYLLQNFEREYAANPDDPDILEKYSDFLWSCLSQNLMQGQVEVLNRELFSTLIRKKIENGGSIQDFNRAIDNDLLRRDYTSAGENLRKMESDYSEFEEFYLMKLKYLISLGRGSDIQKLLQEIEEKHIFLSSKTKEVLAFWEN
ncbi:MAG: hypothetical protein J6V50_04735 [Clostridia bacterium]|nr:hypothetical protein [Clostridia bacterium]